MEPTIYEWAGGEEAFGRWLDASYDLVEEDAEHVPVPRWGGGVAPPCQP